MQAARRIGARPGCRSSQAERPSWLPKRGLVQVDPAAAAAAAAAAQMVLAEALRWQVATSAIFASMSWPSVRQNSVHFARQPGTASMCSVTSLDHSKAVEVVALMAWFG